MESRAKPVALTGWSSRRPLTAGPALGSELGMFAGRDSIHVRAGETHVGDLYAMSGSAAISGRQQGDLIAVTRDLRIDGEVTGDVFGGSETFDVSGRVGDSVRYFAEKITISGTIDGDLIGLAGVIRITERPTSPAASWSVAGRRRSTEPSTATCWPPAARS